MVKKSKKVQDFKQVKIKVGKKLPKNTNVTQPNYKTGQIMLRPQMPLIDIENIDEANKLVYLVWKSKNFVKKYRIF